MPQLEQDDRADQRASRLALGVLLASAAWQVIAACQPAQWLIAWLTVDDTYLALEIAWKWPRVGFPTFDGLQRTNGFQALWGALLWCISSALRSREQLLAVSLLAAAAFNSLAGFTLWKLSARMRGQTAGLWVACLWAALCVSGRPTLIGLENALTAALAASTLALTVRIYAERPTITRWIALGLLLGLLTWARLDALVIAAVLLTGLGAFALRRRAIRGWAVNVAVFVLLGVGLAAFYDWAGGTPTPVSGMVKRNVAAAIEPVWTPAVLLRSVMDAGGQVLKQTALAVGLGWPRGLSAVARVVLTGGLLLVVLRRWVRPSRLVWLWAAALWLHVLALRLWLSAYHLDTMWYFAPQHIALCLAIGLCAATVAERRMRQSWRIGLPTGFAALKIVLALTTFTHVPPGEGVSQNRYAAAQWLKANVAESQRIGAWNAGELAFFSERTVVNLDGLVNSKEYFERIRSGTTGPAYWDEMNIDWIVDYTENVEPLLGPRWREVASFGRQRGKQQLVARRSDAP